MLHPNSGPAMSWLVVQGGKSQQARGLDHARTTHGLADPGNDAIAFRARR
jgi:hypothetical protein